MGIVLTAGYILWLLQRVFYGPPKAEYDAVPDADRLEKVYIFCMVAVIMLIGIYPALLTDIMKMGVLPLLAPLGL